MVRCQRTLRTGIIIANAESQICNSNYDSPIENRTADAIIDTAGALISTGIGAGALAIGAGITGVTDSPVPVVIGASVSLFSGVVYDGFIEGSNLTAWLSYQMIVNHVYNNWPQHENDYFIDPLLKNTPIYDGPNTFNSLENYSWAH
jgi:hypothetical protein